MLELQVPDDLMDNELVVFDMALEDGREVRLELGQMPLITPGSRIQLEFATLENGRVVFDKPQYNPQDKPLTDEWTYTLSARVNGRLFKFFSGTFDFLPEDTFALSGDMYTAEQLRQEAGAPPFPPETPSETPPQTPDPQTPDPQTPDPQTPDPQTPDPQTPDPQTPDPQTPDPQTPPGPGTEISAERADLIALLSASAADRDALLDSLNAKTIPTDPDAIPLPRSNDIIRGLAGLEGLIPDAEPTPPVNQHPLYSLVSSLLLASPAALRPIIDQLRTPAMNPVARQGRMASRHFVFPQNPVTSTARLEASVLSERRPPPVLSHSVLEAPAVAPSFQGGNSQRRFVQNRQRFPVNASGSAGRPST